MFNGSLRKCGYAGGGGWCSGRAHVLCYDLVPQVNSCAINQLVQEYHRVPV